MSGFAEFVCVVGAFAVGAALVIYALHPIDLYREYRKRKANR